MGQSVIDGNAAGTVLTVLPGVSLELDALTVKNGRTSGNGGGILNQGTLAARAVLVLGNVAVTVAVSAGGGIYSTGQLTLTDSTVIGNELQTGGGGIYVSGSTSSALIQGTTISGNVVHDLTTDFRGGGGIHVLLGDATISRSVIAGNTTDYTGGGVAVRGSGSDVQIIDTWIHGNQSRFGGGVITQASARLTISGSTISDNTATSDATAVGGGLRAKAPVTITNSTIAGNSATSTTANSTAGGGIADESSVTLDGVTVTGNSADYGGGSIRTRAPRSSRAPSSPATSRHRRRTGMTVAARSMAVRHC